MDKPGNDLISIVIVEDHPMFREALRNYLETRTDRFEIIADVGTAHEGLQLVKEHVPDIVLLDLGLPERTEEGIEEGLEAIRDIRNASEATRVVILTAHRKIDLVFQAIQAGATAYLLKNHVGGQDVIDSLLRIHAGDPPVDPEIARKLWSFFQNQPVETALPGNLTHRELEILGLIAERKSNDEIAKALVINLSTVKKHVSNILAKLQPRSRVELMLYYRTRYAPLSGGKASPR